MQAWSLLLFTLIVQACVGALLWIEYLQLSAVNERRTPLPDSVHLNSMLGIAIATAVAVSISIFHLGSPINVFFALNNLGASWLSREVLLVMFFGTGVAIATVMRWRRWGSEASRRVIGRTTAVVGVVLVYVMARLYMLPTTPSWNTYATPISFFATSLLLGGSLVLAYLVNPKGSSTSLEAVPPVMVWTLMLVMGIEIALTPYQASILYANPMVVEHGHSFAVLNTLLAVRVLSVAIALGFLFRFLRGPFDRPGRLLLVTVAFVLIGEILGRYIFYAFYYRIGV